MAAISPNQIHLDQVSRPWRRRLGPLPWAVLEELAVSAQPTEHGWAAPVGVRHLGTALGVTKDTAAGAVAALRSAGLVIAVRVQGERGTRSGYHLDLPEGVTIHRPSPDGEDGEHQHSQDGESDPHPLGHSRPDPADRRRPNGEDTPALTSRESTNRGNESQATDWLRRRTFKRTPPSAVRAAVAIQPSLFAEPGLCPAGAFPGVSDV